MADVRLDSYVDICVWNRLILANHPSSSSSDSAQGQCFHHAKANNHKIKTAYFYLKRVGTIGGTLRAALYAITGTCGTNGLPSGGALAQSNTIQTSSISTVKQLLYGFSFPVGQQYELIPNVHYVITIEGVTGTWSGTQYIMVEFGGAVCLGDDGNDCYFDNSAWRLYGTIGDLYFSVWGEEVVPANKPIGDALTFAI